MLCPNGHDNLNGLSHCKVCGLPLLSLTAQVDGLSERLASRQPMGRPLPRTVLIGLGTAGAGVIDIAKAVDTDASRTGTSYVAIDTNGTAAPTRPADLLLLTLGKSTANAATFCGIGETLVRDDPSLMPLLRKGGLARPDGGQTVLLVAAIGGGIGSAVSVIATKCRQLNPLCHLVGLLIVPGAEESFHNQLNAYYGLSRLLEIGSGSLPDMVITVNFHRIRRLRGVSTSGEELKSEGLLAALGDLMVRNLSAQAMAEAARINRAMGVTLMVPCLALGRSLEIFGNLSNVFESAFAFPASNPPKRDIVICHLLLSVPESRASEFQPGMVGEELSAFVKRRLPSVKSTSLSVTYSAAQHDRVDACLLLGGDRVTQALFANGDELAGFQAELARQRSWVTYGLTEENIRQAGQTLARCDLELDLARGLVRGEDRPETTEALPDSTVDPGGRRSVEPAVDAVGSSLSKTRKPKTAGNHRSSNSDRPSSRETSKFDNKRRRGEADTA